MPTAIDIRGVSKVYRAGARATVALDDVSLRIEPGELFFLLGPSGCGKTTLLRTIAGFLEPTKGQVLFNGADMTRVPPNKRNTGMVFQSYALWPHMTVEANVAFGLGVRRTPAAERARRIAEVLRAVRMEAYAKHKPNELSGGQQQRVALARALVIRPDVLLLDEPLSNLDARLRLELRDEIRAICKAFEGGLTTVYVTHDQQEAMSMADRIALLRWGRIEQLDDPATLYRQPRSVFAASFLGEVNLFPCRVVEVSAGRARIESPLGPGEFVYPGDGDGPYSLALRPEAIRLEGTPQAAAGMLSAPATVRGVSFMGESTRYEAVLPSGEAVRTVRIGLPSLGVGASVHAVASPDDAVLLPDGAQHRAIKPPAEVRV